MLKSIIDVDVNDEKFKAFQELFAKYQEQLRSMPGAWAGVNKEMRSSFESVSAAMLAQNEFNRKQAEDEKRRKEEGSGEESRLHRVSNYWIAINKSTGQVARNLYNSTLSLIKWTGLTSIAGGLLGAGGLFGIDQLAHSVSAGRRSSTGLGLSYGEQKSFELNFGRYVDAPGVLSGVNEALHDVTKRYTLYGAGLSERDIAGKDTGQVSSLLLQHLKSLADATPDNQLAQVLSARGLDRFVGIEDFERLKATSRSELGDAFGNFPRDAKSFNLSEKTQKQWQDLSVQLSKASANIKNAFVDGLTPLVPQLTALSHGFADVVTSFLHNKDIKKWLVDASAGLERFSKYVGSKEFTKDVQDLASDIGTLGDAVAGFLRAIGSHTMKDAAFGATAGFLMGGPGGAVVGGIVGAGVGKLRDGTQASHTGPNGETVIDNPDLVGRGFVDDHKYHWWRPESYKYDWGRPNDTNPGNIRTPDGRGYASFASPEVGVRKVADQLLRYEHSSKWGNLDTIAKIVATYAPKKDGNDVAAYVADVSQRTKIGANAHLNLDDTAVLGKLVSAILRHENGRKNKGYTPEVVVKILNNTGGSAVASASALK